MSARLRELGFVVLASEAFDAAWNRRVREAGGFYDIVTGQPDLSRRRALRAGSLRELHEQKGARFVLQQALVVVTVDFTSGKAEWDGAKEMAAPMGSGEVPALSLDLRVEGLDGSEIASSRWGIQLLAKQSAFKTKIGPVPREKLLEDEKDLTEAVRRGLGPLLDAMRAALEIAPPSEGAEPGSPIETSPPVEIQPPPEGARVAALRPVWPDRPDLTVPREVKTRCLDHLRSRLEEAGRWALPPEAFEQTFRAVVLESGGIYDPITGRGDPAKGMAATGETRRRLAEQYGATVFLPTGIVVRQANFYNEKAAYSDTEIMSCSNIRFRTT